MPRRQRTASPPPTIDDEHDLATGTTTTTTRKNNPTISEIGEEGGPAKKKVRLDNVDVGGKMGNDVSRINGSPSTKVTDGSGLGSEAGGGSSGKAKGRMSDVVREWENLVNKKLDPAASVSSPGGKKKKEKRRKGKASADAVSGAEGAVDVDVDGDEVARMEAEVDEEVGEPVREEDIDERAKQTTKVELTGSTSTPANGNGVSLEVPQDMEADGFAKPKVKGKKKKHLDQTPEFHFDTAGFKNSRMVNIKDLRDLVLHLLLEEKAPNWLLVKNKRSLKRVIVLLIPGLLPTSLGLPTTADSTNIPLLSRTRNLPFPISPPTEGPSNVPVFQTLFSHACPTSAPGEKLKMHSPYQNFLNVPLSEGEKVKREKEREKAQSTRSPSDPSTYLLTPTTMKEHNYPFPHSYSFSPGSPHGVGRTIYDSSGEVYVPPKRKPGERPRWEEWKRGRLVGGESVGDDEDGWIETPVEEVVEKEGRMKVFALDCEMCMTEQGSELVRITVVDEKSAVVYDTLVKPDLPIIDYLTRWSGMTAERLEGVTTRLEDVQRRLTELVDSNTILIGHSLDCDLTALKFAHPWVIDTSLLYQHPRGPPFKPSLKWLAQKWLGREIQAQDRSVPSADGVSVVVGGHDSEEDARTCIELLEKKLSNGPSYGQFAVGTESIFDKLARGPNPKTSAVIDHGSPGQYHGTKAKTSIACRTDEEVTDGVLRSMAEHDFTFGRLMELSHAVGWTQPSTSRRPNLSLSSSTDGDRGQSSSTSTPAAGPSTTPMDSPLPESVPNLATDSMQPPLPDPDVLSKVYTDLSARISAIHTALPPQSALIIFTGHGDPREMARLTAKKAKFDKMWKMKKPSEVMEMRDRWMEQDERDLIAEVDQCRIGMSFFCVK